ncbi:putative Mitochondrial import inner membrane translocase subunit tim16-B [Hypsibius exemplaris]|uniref:Mitochondrial import inner membrane translocase subunit tim16-B n=1 Tax=Hypsibius exemplaris TaxID=2072580 RepID=A0A1W0X982_HYPEX|nr:putative Mitochondrial import inner membrane translocase subunit tim16-B [Hypsibius exemplaris]
MAGPGKYLAQLVIMGAQVVGRAFSKALREEIQRSQAAAASRGGGGAASGDTSRAAAVSSRMGMSVQEAKQILNLTSAEAKLTPELLQEKFDHLFKVNDKAVGGSFYLQSKVVRAKERLEEEMKSLEAAPKKNQRASDNAAPPPP